MKSLVIAIGNMGQDAEVKTLNSGNQVLNFSCAENESYKDKEGNKVEKTIWHNCKMFKKEFSEKFVAALKKGTKIIVKGELRYDEYEKENVAVKSAYIRVTELDFA